MSNVILRLFYFWCFGSRGTSTLSLFLSQASLFLLPRAPGVERLSNATCRSSCSLKRHSDKFILRSNLTSIETTCIIKAAWGKIPWACFALRLAWFPRKACFLSKLACFAFFWTQNKHVLPSDKWKGVEVKPVNRSIKKNYCINLNMVFCLDSKRTQYVRYVKKIHWFIDK